MSDFGFDDLNDFVDNVEKEKDDSIRYFSDNEIISEVVKRWRKWETVQEWIDNIIDKPSAMFQFNRLCQGYEDGYNISLLFNPHRLTTRTYKKADIYSGFNDDETYRKQFARFITKTQGRVPPYRDYIRMIGIGTGGYQYVNEFRPYLARDIYKAYCKDGDKILNPCAGWGGRLLGIASCMFKDIEYVETEPQTQTYKGLCEMKRWLGLGENYKQYNLPFEELELEDDYFDFVFTSPPYYDTEIYSGEETQSCVRYKNYDDWKQGFLYTMIDKIFACMKKGAKCVLNVGNVRYPIETDVVEYIKNKKIGIYNVDSYGLGGFGIGARTGDGGEPFIMFEKN